MHGFKYRYANVVPYQATLLNGIPVDRWKQGDEAQSLEEVMRFAT